MMMLTHYNTSHLASIPRRMPFTRAHLAQLGILSEDGERDQHVSVALSRTDALTLVNRWNREQHASGWAFWIDGDSEY